jgi:hypothetical protein
VDDESRLVKVKREKVDFTKRSSHARCKIYEMKFRVEREEERKKRH